MFNQDLPKSKWETDATAKKLGRYSVKTCTLLLLVQ